MLKSKERYELIAAFERSRKERFDKEDKSLWAKGIVYQDGRVNALFLAYRDGYAYGKVYGQSVEAYDVESDLKNVIASRDGYKADTERMSLALSSIEVALAEAERNGASPFCLDGLIDVVRCALSGEPT